MAHRGRYYRDYDSFNNNNNNNNGRYNYDYSDNNKEVEVGSTGVVGASIIVLVILGLAVFFILKAMNSESGPVNQQQQQQQQQQQREQRIIIDLAPELKGRYYLNRPTSNQTNNNTGTTAPVPLPSLSASTTTSPSTPVPTAPVPTALILRPAELDTGMSMRFMYARGIGMLPSVSSIKQCDTQVDCYDTLAPKNRRAHCVVVIDLVSAATTPSKTVLVVMDDDGKRKLEFDTAPVVRGDGLLSGGTATVVGMHMVYSFKLNQDTAASTKVRVRVHSSVDRAVFLWSDTAPMSTSGI
jgi:hypothetical protein